MFQDILAAIPLGVVVAFLFGPVFFVLLETAAIKGARAAVFFDIGVIVADVLFIFVAYFSTSSLLNRLKDDPNLFIFGGLLLIVYGLITFFREKICSEKELKSRRRQVTQKKGKMKLFAKGFLLNFVNIGVLGFWLGLIIAVSPTMNMEPERLMIFFTTVIVTYFAVDIGKIILAKKLRHKLTSTRIFKLKRTISALIFAFGMILIAKGIFPSRMQEIQNKMEHVIPDTTFKQGFKHR